MKQLNIHLENKGHQPLPHIIHKSQFEMDYGPKIMKLLEVLGKYLCDLRVSKDFLGRIQKV